MTYLQSNIEPKHPWLWWGIVVLTGVFLALGIMTLFP